MNSASVAWQTAALLGIAGSLLRPGGAPRLPALIINGQPLLHAHRSQYRASPFAEGVDAVFRSIDEIGVSVRTGRVRAYETVAGRDLADFGLVQVMSYPRPTSALLNVLDAYLRRHRVRAVGMSGIAVPTKLFHYVRLAQAALRVPSSAYLPPDVIARSHHTLVHELGDPYLLTALTSCRRHDAVVAGEAELRAHLRAHADVRFLAQEIVPNLTTLRLLILGGRVGVVERRAVTAGGAAAGRCAGTLLDPRHVDPAATWLAARVATVFEADVAKVELIQHWSTGRWYVLDVDRSPAIGGGDFAGVELEAYSAYLGRLAR